MCRICLKEAKNIEYKEKTVSTKKEMNSCPTASTIKNLTSHIF